MAVNAWHKEVQECGGQPDSGQAKGSLGSKLLKQEREGIQADC